MGKRLLLSVGDIMRKGRENPIVKEETKVKTALLSITRARAGSASVVDRKGRLKGIFTDGDLRRLSQTREDFLNLPVTEVMGHRPHTIELSTLASAALARMEEHAITQLVVTDAKEVPVGVIHLHDLLKAGIV